MRVLFVASEAYPFAKVGGLGDVAGSLPKALGELGHEVNLIMPRYPSMERWRVDLGPFDVPMGGGKEVAALKEGNLTHKVPVLMVDHPGYFARERVYGYEDDGRRYSFFSRAVLEACIHINFSPEIIHCNDWHTALIPAYLRSLYSDVDLFSRTKTLFTIHNLMYQGVFPTELLEYTGLPEELASEAVLLHDGKINFMKAAITLADAVNAVSETYSREIQTSEYGYQLEEVLRQNRHKLHGVLNGLDLEIWNPRSDPLIPRTYEPTDRKGKGANKRALQREIGLPKERGLLLGFIGRLTGQKGVDVLLDALPQMLLRKLQLVILGTGEKSYEEDLRAWDGRHPNISLKLGYDEALAHRIYSGVDAFLMPSRFEPCGLGQQISMTYGTIPIVRRTGGLADTVQEYSHDAEGGTGFTFDEYTGAALLSAIDRALEVYAQKDRWRRLMENCAKQDFSWERSARAYADIYEKLKLTPSRPHP